MSYELVREQAIVIWQGIALLILYILRVIISGNKESGWKAKSYTAVCVGGFTMVGPGRDMAVVHSSSQELRLPVQDQASQTFSLGEEEVMQPTLAEELLAVHDTVELL